MPTPANQNIADYNPSRERGTQQLIALLRDRFQRCPGIRIGLIGYSQGADVINETLGRITIEERGIIRSVLLLGDPTSAGNTSYDLAVNPDGTPGTHNGVCCGSRSFPRELGILFGDRLRGT